MEKEVYSAAAVGDVTVFSNKNEEQLLRKTSQKNNIMHIAAQHGQIHFIQAVLDNLPQTPTCESLICDQNRHGNTPLHIAAEVGDEAVVHLLYEYFTTQCGSSERVFPWRVVNKDGNTPAHVALLYGNVSVAVYLVEKDGCLARVLNHSMETLLHLATQYHVVELVKDFHKVKPPSMLAALPNIKLVDALVLSPNKLANGIVTPISRWVFLAASTANLDDRKQETQGPRPDLWPIIELLLEIDSSVTCWEDTNGATPLHGAASLKPAYYCIRVIKAMLASCPEAAEVYDEGSGQTILHRLTNHQVASYEQGLELLHIPQVYALRNTMNHQGDTPLHLAARNRDNNMVQVLLERSAKLCIQNKSGVSAGTLVRQLEEVRLKETMTENRRKLTKAELEAAKEGNVAFLNEKLVSLGTNFLVSRTPKGGNILHMLMQCEFNDYKINEVEEFIGEAIQKLPLLISQKDSKGDTPIHVLAENSYEVRLLELSRKYLDKAREEAGADASAELYNPPWRLKNLKGDTPLHAAVRVQNYKAAIKLLEFDDEVAGYVNNRLQTPLHLLAAYEDCYNGQMDPIICTLITCLINGNAELPYMQDEDGLTPLLTAAKKSHAHIIRELFRQFSYCSSDVADNKGRTMWHWFATHGPYVSTFHDDYRLVDLVRENRDSIIWFIRAMMCKDNDGNTPLHLAILNQHFSLAKNFLDEKNMWYWNYILKEENNEGHSCYDLIGSAEHLPDEFEKHLGDYLLPYRSKYGVPTTKIGEYANTIGVIAALLATITFTAAFTVPGGLDSNNGTPLLLQKAAFQVFMVADIAALYSSVIVLFCLLWIVTTTSKKDTISLLDVSVFLLRTSFLATLVAFMTGLYVTTIQFAPAIAISTCATCSLLIILMQKRLFMLTVMDFCRILIFYGRVLGLIGSHMWSRIKTQYEDRFHPWSWIKTQYRNRF